MSTIDQEMHCISYWKISMLLIKKTCDILHKSSVLFNFKALVMRKQDGRGVKVECNIGVNHFALVLRLL